MTNITILLPYTTVQEVVAVEYFSLLLLLRLFSDYLELATATVFSIYRKKKTGKVLQCMRFT